MKQFLFSSYSYLFNLVYLVLEILPPAVRNLIFKLIFKKYGKKNNIDYRTYFRYPSKICIGNQVWINRGCQLFGSYYKKEVGIIIGNNVAIGPNVVIFTATHNYQYLDLPDEAATVTVEDNVWIGGNSTILPGVTIGEGCVIGAGSTVTKSIPPYTIAVGNPAVVIKRRVIK